MPGKLSLFRPFSNSGLDRGGNLCDQDHSGSGAEVKGSAHLIGKQHFRRFYRLGGAVGRGLHGRLSLAVPGTAISNKACLMPD